MRSVTVSDVDNDGKLTAYDAIACMQTQYVRKKGGLLIKNVSKNSRAKKHHFYCTQIVTQIITLIKRN